MERATAESYASDVDLMVDRLAEAYLVIHDASGGPKDANTLVVDVSDFGYISDDWAKDVERVLRAYVQVKGRPPRWPWTSAELDALLEG